LENRWTRLKTAYSSTIVETEDSREEAIRRELERVLSSAGFSRNQRLSQFLRFLVDRHLEGRDSELKESVIAVEVFGRKAGYDPKLDGIVRTEAVRLRARMERYYQAEGSQDALIIELPKGGYRPVFRERATGAEETATPKLPQKTNARAGRTWWITGALAALVVVAIGTTWWWTRATRRSFIVAVLPLENVGHDPASDYFTDGLTDEIIRNLSVIDGLTVPSRTSSFALKGKGLNAGEAGKQLGADYLVEGSVLHAGDQLRITVALVRARDDYRLWSDRFDRRLTDVFAIQDEISQGIVNTLRLRLSPNRRRYETNLEAYDLYLRGRQIMASFPTRGRPIALPAVEYFEKAIEKDPNYAIAYAGMADAFVAVERNMGTTGTVWGPLLPRAKAAAERAVELDPMLSEAHSARASIRAREYAWQDADRGFRRAIELNPNNALAHLERGAILVVQGRFDEGLDEGRRALALDPLSPYANTEVGGALLLAGRYAESVDQLRKARALDPSRNRPYNLMGRALYLQGKTAEALAVFDESIKRGARPPGAGGPDWLACAEVRAGRREKAVVLLQEQLSRPRGTRLVAGTYACLGDEEHALEYLEKSLAENEPGLAELLQAPELASMRANPRFAKLRRKVNLPS
jgi:TolB-like protein/Tfp pilus assembly protein PilF